MGSHISLAKPDHVWLRRYHCPTCEKRRFFMGWHQEWYGSIFTCLKCGERFSNDEMLPRPFCRGWRKDNIASAKKFYRKNISLVRKIKDENKTKKDNR